MGKYHFVLFLAFLFLVPLIDNGVMAAATLDGSEQWGYVEVRPKAHMFWWYYKSPQRTEDPDQPWPIILWLQGGPGSSGVGLGNFQEIGPLDTYLKPRNSTWLQKADLLFVDNPVGTGYSYVEDDSSFAKTDEEAATDVITLLISVFNTDEVLQKSPLNVVAESYGGKWAVLGSLALKAIEAGNLKLKLGGCLDLIQTLIHIFETTMCSVFSFDLKELYWEILGSLQKILCFHGLLFLKMFRGLTTKA